MSNRDAEGGASAGRRPRRRLSLQALLFLCLVGFGILPVAVSSILSVTRTGGMLEREEKLALSDDAVHLSERFELRLALAERQLEQLEASLVAAATRLDRGRFARWLPEQLSGFVAAASRDFVTVVMDLDREDRVYRPAGSLGDAVEKALRSAREAAADGTVSRYRLVGADGYQEPWVLVARRFEGGPARVGSFLLAALVPLDFSPAPGQEYYVLEIDSGTVVWAAPSRAEVVIDAVEGSAPVVESLGVVDDTYPVLEYELAVGTESDSMIGQVSRLGETPWAVLVQQRKSAALAAAGSLARSAVLSLLLTTLLASLFAVIGSRVIGGPIRALAEGSREIAQGRFGAHVEPRGMASEVVDLADSFNTMSDEVESHTAKLQRAAQENGELFIGSVRALLAAVEAKEPYTRGHSERVASYSRAIARRLEQTPQFLDEVWLAGLLHDVGKIGIEDRVLNKGDILTADEFQEMKRHPVIGAEIMSSIEPLKNVLPAIRWHHEKWDGGGYPDGLAGDEIPLLARIVAVADTFDAVTTQRVYQDPLGADEGVQIIRKLEGKSFDPRVAAAFYEAFHRGDIELLPMTHRQRATGPVDEKAAVHT